VALFHSGTTVGQAVELLELALLELALLELALLELALLELALEVGDPRLEVSGALTLRRCTKREEAVVRLAITAGYKALSKTCGGGGGDRQRRRKACHVTR
jgi:hypothetical protein